MKKLIKRIFVLALSFFYRNDDAILVFSGPLKGYKIPKRMAFRHLRMLFGKYEEGFSNSFFRSVQVSGVIYDIGANTGYFSLLALTNDRSSVVAFEPMSNVAAEFSTLMSVNGVSKKARLIQIALSNKRGEVVMLTPGPHEMGLMETVLRGQAVEKSEGVLVPMSTLDDIVEEKNLPPPALIKLDVEGAEELVLEGSKNLITKYRPIIYVEVHGREPAEGVWRVATELEYKLSLVGSGTDKCVLDRNGWLFLFRENKWAVLHVVLDPA